MLEFEVTHPASGPFDHFLECGEIFGVDASADHLEGHRSICRPKLEKPTELLRPDDFVRLYVPGKAAGRTQLLCSFEKCRTSPERFVAAHSLNGGARDVSELRDQRSVTNRE